MSQRQKRTRKTGRGQLRPVPSTPTRWYGISDISDPNAPRLLFASQDRAEVRRKEREITAGQDPPLLLWQTFDYDPTQFTLVRKHQPDVKAQVLALDTLLDAAGQHRGGQS